MKITNTFFFRFLLCPALFTLAIYLLVISFRFTAFVLLVALVMSYFQFLDTSRTKSLRLLATSFLIAVSLPIDVSVRNVPGPPRFIPVVMGLPMPEDFDRAKRGEMVLGGCLVSGNEPRWVLVW